MRIIAGEFRGRRLLPPQGEVTRPITDRVKQSLFDILTPLLPGARVYDLFAGTGSIGLECLSRGAKHVIFFEADRPAVARLRQNIEGIGLGDRSEVVAGDLFKWFARSGQRAGESSNSRADLVFLDPPYRFLRDRPDDLRRLVERLIQDHLAPDGAIVFRHGSADALALPNLTLADRREYGGMTIELLRANQKSESEPKLDSDL